jgi:molybdopterin/thiamine biosynthesis adenylyltransferase
MRLARTVEVFEASDGDVYVLRGGADADFTLEAPDAAARVLLRRLAGAGGDVDSLAAACGRPAPEVAAALDELDGLGLLEREGDRDPGLLDDEALARFDRQLAYFAQVQPGAASAMQARLADAHVAVIGVGGLGTWTASALACAGVGTLTLVDDDTVDLSNLNRQVLYRRSDLGRPKVEVASEALRAFDPSLTVDPRRVRITGAREAERVVTGHDFVIELADWPPYELSRWLDAACWPAGIPRVTAALYPPTVRIGPTYVRGATPCLGCQEAVSQAAFPLYDELAALRAARPTVAPTLGPPCALIGGVIAMDVVHHLTGIAQPATLGTALIVDTRDMRVEREPVPRRAGCDRCCTSGAERP